jgi:hypothetical protein
MRCQGGNIVLERDVAGHAIGKPVETGAVHRGEGGLAERWASEQGLTDWR